MDLKVLKICPASWKLMAKDAHLSVFGDLRDSSLDRIDYALLVTQADETLLQYVTIRELDEKSVYFQYGGSFPSCRGSVVSWQSFQVILSWLKERYKRVSFLAENTNRPMLKFGLKAGFLITGIRVFKQKILLEHALEFEGVN